MAGTRGRRRMPRAERVQQVLAAAARAFASYAEDCSASAIETSERRLAADIQDPVAVRCTVRMAFRVTIEAVIAWLEVGDPARDQAFLEAMTVPFSWARQAAAKVAGEPRT